MLAARRALSRRGAALAALVPAAALVLASCSSDDSSSSAEQQDGGTLVYATGDAEPTCLDPHVGGNYPQAMLTTQVLEPLVGRDAEGEILPWLATGWEISEDGLTWDFTLAEGITFTDGTPFDAEAVKVNVEHLQDPATQSSTGYLALAKVSEVEVVDATHARFHLTEPDSALAESLSQPWLAIESPTGIARGMDANCAAPVGTGPFVVESWTPQQQVDLVRNDDYATSAPEATHEGAAHLDRIVWRFIPDAATRYAALQSGEVQVIDNPQPDAIATAQAGGDISDVDAPRPGSVNRLELNSGQAPFDHVRIREAFVRAADVDPGIESLYAGTVTRSYSPLSSSEPMAVSDDSLFGTDPAAADDLLDEAGWTERDAEGYRTKDGKRLSARWIAYTPVPDDRTALANAIQADLKDIGFEVVREVLEPGAYNAQYGPKTFDLTDWGFSGVDPDLLRSHLHTDGFQNASQVSDPEIDTLLDTAVAVSDQGERDALYTQLQEWNATHTAIVPLYSPSAITAVGERLSGLDYDLYGRPLFYDVTVG